MPKNTLTSSVSMPIKFDSTAGNLKKLLEKIPDNAKVGIHVTRADRPQFNDQKELRFSWEEEL